jgi:hypothetical protein
MESKQLSNEARLIRIDIIDAAYRLWAERYEEIIASGDEYGNGPNMMKAWDKYLDRGAYNYPWWVVANDDGETHLNEAGDDAYLAFAAAFEDAPGVYGMLNAR